MSVSPYYDYGYNYSAADPAVEGMAGFLLVFLIVFYLLMLAVAVAAYIFQSLGLYTVAKRRGIHNPWLAWIPIGNMWLMGSISDQYQYVAKGRVRNRRKILLGLMIAMYAVMIVMYIAYFGFIFGIVGAGGALVGGALALVLLTALAVVVLAIITVVYEYIAIYDLYVSCDPENGVLYLVLSIFFSISMPILFFICRNKDLGMPPRKPVQAVQPELQPAQEPVQPQEVPVTEPEEVDPFVQKPEE